MDNGLEINTGKNTISSGTWKFWFVILLFAVAFCDGSDDKDLHDALIDRVKEKTNDR